MQTTDARNRQFLTDLFSGPFAGHAIIIDPPATPSGMPGDYTCSEYPLTRWLDWMLREYEAKIRWQEQLDDDNVLCARIVTGTQLFAAAFGCRVEIAPQSNAFALPLVETAAEADALAVPAVDAGPLGTYFEFAQMLRDRLGPDVPISVPDIQSPFDIAALIWHKEKLFMALMDDPDAVKRLVGKCQQLLIGFLREVKLRFPECNLCHCPNAWAPPELGCWLSEDEAGSMSVSMFEEFCLPSLVEMSESFGGLFMHCCATADHQYNSFKKIPNLRGINRVFQAPGPRPAIEAFSGESVLMQAWMSVEQVEEMVGMALPETRFLCNMGAQSLDEAKRTYERLRKCCPRG